MIGKLAIVVGILFLGPGCIAQAPAGAPAGATGLCNDGTYFTGATKSGACRGHKGLKTWYGAPAAASAKTSFKTTGKAITANPKSAHAPAPAATTAAPTPAPAASSASTSKTTRTATQAPAPGGGPGLVWVNTASNVYHCPGTQWYGKTKAGAYMSESDARAKGAHPQGGKACK